MALRVSLPFHFVFLGVPSSIPSSPRRRLTPFLLLLFFLCLNFPRDYSFFFPSVSR